MDLIQNTNVYELFNLTRNLRCGSSRGSSSNGENPPLHHRGRQQPISWQKKVVLYDQMLDYNMAAPMNHMFTSQQQKCTDCVHQFSACPCPHWDTTWSVFKCLQWSGCGLVAGGALLLIIPTIVSQEDFSQQKQPFHVKMEPWWRFGWWLCFLVLIEAEELVNLRRQTQRQKWSPQESWSDGSWRLRPSAPSARGSDQSRA